LTTTLSALARSRDAPTRSSTVPRSTRVICKSSWVCDAWRVPAP
jgi:hypothetical protein